MQRKIIAETAFSWGPLWERAELVDKAKLCYAQMEELMSRSQWNGEYISVCNGKLCESTFTTYMKLKNQLSLFQKELHGREMETKLNVNEMRKILVKLRASLIERSAVLSKFEGKDITGSCLDKYDLKEMEEEIYSIQKEINTIEQELKSRYVKRVIVVLDREDGFLFGTHNNHHENNERREHERRHMDPNSQIRLINFSTEKRRIIAEAFHGAGISKSIFILDETGNRLEQDNDISNVLLHHTYFLNTENGLRPFSNLEEVERYLYLHDEKEWENVVKLKIIPEHNRHVGNEVIRVRQSVSTYPIVHEFKI